MDSVRVTTVSMETQECLMCVFLSHMSLSQYNNSEGRITMILKRTYGAGNMKLTRSRRRVPDRILTMSIHCSSLSLY